MDDAVLPIILDVTDPASISEAAAEVASCRGSCPIGSWSRSGTGC
jgi:hypothetical protein